MKKMLAIISLFIIMIGSTGTKNDFSLLDYFDGEYYAYSYTPLTDDYIFLGSCYMNLGEVGDVANSKIVGESMIIYDFEVASAIAVLNAEVVKTEYLEAGATVIYCFSDMISRSVEIADGVEVNFQIAYYETYSVIGWPVILGSF